MFKINYFMKKFKCSTIILYKFFIAQLEILWLHLLKFNRSRFGNTSKLNLFPDERNFYEIIDMKYCKKTSFKCK